MSKYPQSSEKPTLTLYEFLDSKFGDVGVT